MGLLIGNDFNFLLKSPIISVGNNHNNVPENRSNRLPKPPGPPRFPKLVKELHGFGVPPAWAP
jgi:hypothetical protein